jgi:group I intron endonuclease
MAIDKETWILYQTTNLVNHKIYVGVHKIADTWRSRSYLGSGDKITAAIRKYGRENFERITLAEFSCVEDVYTAEAEIVTEDFVKRLDTYNISRGGRGGANITAEMKIKMRDAKIGKKLSEEHKAKIGAASKGNTYRLGKVLSEETKAKISESCKGNQNCLGKKHSKETIEKRNSANRGKVLTEETKAKIRANRKGINTGFRNPCSIAVIINNKYYESMNGASKGEGNCLEAVRNRVKSIEPKWLEWRYATEEEKSEYTTKNTPLIEGTLN